MKPTRSQCYLKGGPGVIVIALPPWTGVHLASESIRPGPTNQIFQGPLDMYIHITRIPNFSNFTWSFDFRIGSGNHGKWFWKFSISGAPAGRSGNGFHFFSRLESSRCNFRFAVQPSDRMETGSCQLFFPGWPLGRV